MVMSVLTILSYIVSYIGLMLLIGGFLFLYMYITDPPTSDDKKIKTAIKISATILISGIILIFVAIRFSPVDPEKVERRQKEEQRKQELIEWGRENGVDNPWMYVD